jgi:outer membrane biosynthesis protein TonB
MRRDWVAGWIGLISSVLLHAALFGATLFVGSFTLSLPEQQAEMVISIADARLPVQDLPPLGESQEAGPVNTGGSPEPQPQAQPAVTEEIAEPEIEETPTEEAQEEADPEPEPVEETPEPAPEQTRSDPEPQPQRETPVEQPVREETKTEPAEKPADTEVVSTNPAPAEREQPEEPAEPTPREVARQLQEKRGTRSKTFNTAGGGTATGLVAPAGGSSNGISSGPALYNSNLTQLISVSWQPPVYPPGTVRDCTVEFTIYSPPLERNAVNKIRVARVMNIRIIEGSGDPLYDQRALEAVRRISSWPPPPDSYRKETLVVTCRFYLVGE